MGLFIVLIFEKMTIKLSTNRRLFTYEDLCPKRYCGQGID